MGQKDDRACRVRGWSGLGRRVVAALRWLGGHELGLLLALGTAAALWAFFAIADEILEGDSHAMDRRAVLLFRSADDVSDPIGPGWFEEAARDMTALGGWAVLTLVTAAVVGYLLLDRRLAAAGFVAAAVTGGWLLSVVLKASYQRPRPDLVPHLSQVATTSFPSGHAMNAAVVYLTLGALLTRLESRRLIKGYVLLVAIVLAGLVGVSRVYLGVHYPTDVLAGWTAGLGWACLCWAVARLLQRRGAIDQPDPGAAGPAE